VLLVRRRPLADLDTFMAEVGALVPAIAPSPAGLVLAGEKGTRFVPAEKPRGLGDEPVRREEGAVASLVEHAREQGSVVRLIAFPHGADGSSYD
jgi:hypothetical protein